MPITSEQVTSRYNESFWTSCYMRTAFWQTLSSLYESDHIHAPAVLSRYTLQPVWTQWRRRGRFLTLPEPRTPSPLPVSNLTNSMRQSPSEPAATQLVKIFPAAFYGTSEGSLPYSQQPTTGACPQPHQSSPHLPPYFPKIHSNIIFPSKPTSSEWSLPFRFSDQNVV
jgi:hypothetical protein